MPVYDNANILIGLDMPDDAAVFRVTDDLVIVQTVDFITPVVDDPHLFGRIAAANALSDIWAMGVEPAFALNIVAYPSREAPLEHLADILRGGADTCREAGIPILGGHSIDDREPKYGLVVTGLARPGEILRKAGARPGDHLILTKPLGIGIITTAMRADKSAPSMESEAVAAMLTLNRDAARIARQIGGVHACTDVTGFGLLGHLWEMLRQSGVSAEIRAGAIPIIEGALELAAQGLVPGGTRRNLQFMEGKTTWDTGIPETLRLVLADATTSGGLLLATDQASSGHLLAALRDTGLRAAVIGKVVPSTEGPNGLAEPHVIVSF